MRSTRSIPCFGKPYDSLRRAVWIPALVLLACPVGGGAEAPRILFDTDMGSDCDDAGALAALHAYADAGEAEIIGCLYSSGKVPYGAAVIQAINIAFGRPELPVGALHDPDFGDPVDKMNAAGLARRTADFGHEIVHNRDAPELVALARRLLAGQPNDSVTYLTVGHTRGLHDLLKSEPDAASPLTGRELVRRKVSRWVALGALGGNNPDGAYRRDWNFSFNGTAVYTDRLLESFPAPVVLVSAGHDVMTGRRLAELPAGHILRVSYTQWLDWYGGKTLADQRPSWDLAAVVYAVEGPGEFLVDAGPGEMLFEPGQGSSWRPGGADSPHRLVEQRPGTDGAFAEYLNELMLPGE